MDAGGRLMTVHLACEFYCVPVFVVRDIPFYSSAFVFLAFIRCPKPTSARRLVKLDWVYQNSLQHWRIVRRDSCSHHTPLSLV